MFVRVKSTPNSPRKSVQIVESYRKGDKVSQKIVRYVGIAMDDNELEQLKLLAESIKIKLEADNQELLFSPEQIRQHLINVQTSILLDTKKRIRYGLPSRMSQEARKIYQVQAIERRITPYIINKL